MASASLYSLKAASLQGASTGRTVSSAFRGRVQLVRSNLQLCSLHDLTPTLWWSSCVNNPRKVTEEQMQPRRLIWLSILWSCHSMALQLLAGASWGSSPAIGWCTEISLDYALASLCLIGLQPVPIPCFIYEMKVSQFARNLRTGEECWCLCCEWKNDTNYLLQLKC